MTAIEIGIIIVLSLAAMIGIIVEARILIKHNKATLAAIAAMPQDIKNHVSNTAIMVNTAVKNVEVKVDKVAANTAATVDAKKKEVSDYLDKLKASL